MWKYHDSVIRKPCSFSELFHSRKSLLDIIALTFKWLGVVSSEFPVIMVVSMNAD